MKRIKLFLLLTLLASSLTVSAMGRRAHGHHHHRRCVKVPLDGGLLTVLGAAGVAYFVARKKKQ